MFKSRNAHQGIHKRSLASVYHLFEDEGKSSSSQSPAQLNESFSITEGKDVFFSSLHDHANGGRLVRSQSFPPEGWYKTSSKYILNTSKLLEANVDVCESACGSRGNQAEEHSLCSKPMSDLNDASLGHVISVPVERSCALRLTPEQIYNHPAIPVSVVNSMEGGLSHIKALSGCNDPSAMTVAGGVVNMQDDSSSADMEDAACPVSPNHPAVTADMTDAACPVSPNRPAVTSEPAPANHPQVPVSAIPAVTEEPVPASHPQVPVSAIPPGGKLLVCGRRREMEDTVAIVPAFFSCGRYTSESGMKVNQDWHFYGVFDGHGGSQASTYCKERLHEIVAEELFKVNASGVGEDGVVDGGNLGWEEVMKAAFSAIDKEVGGVCPNATYEGEDGTDRGCVCCEHAIAPENVGTTAVVAIIGSHQIVVGNCGDSRAVLGRGGHATPLSRDHKPELEDENRRIEAAGGRVIRWDGYRVGGLLALSRAIGDRYLKRYVISEPETTCTERSEEDEFLILASDGLWDVVSNEFACEVARKSLPVLRKKYASRSCAPDEDAASAAVAALLVKLAYGRGSKDNISVVVVDLKSRQVEREREQG